MNETATNTLPTQRCERGASLVEYSLLVALIAVVAIVAVRGLGEVVANQFERSNDVLIGTGSVIDEDR